MGEKWEVLVKLEDDTTSGISPNVEKMTAKQLEDADAEIAVIRKDNEHGHKSWGWDDDDKIILFPDQEIYSKELLEWRIKVAKAIAKTLNEEGL